MTRWVFVLTVAVVIAAPTGARAGAWVRDKGEMFVALQYYYYETSRFFDHSGNSQKRGGKFKKKEINPYIEYGITSQDTLFLNLFYDWLTDNAAEPSSSNSGLTDVECGWRRLLLQQPPQVLSLQTTVIVPTGYDLDEDPRLGYDRFGMELAMFYGRSLQWADRYGFVEGGVGFRHYFGYPAEQIRSYAMLGQDIWEHFQLLGAAELHYGLNNGSNKNIGTNITVEPNYRLLKVSLGGRLRLRPNCSLVLAYYRHMWGEDTGAGGGFYGSLWITVK
ncbi:MAG: hypothetical protein JRJ12_13005 [Deltaproteobacteria bacterium]|nr:hypothetical protein [Deltaproteobacteria bacterium]MBW2072683.1 hypothetical protein [Deltaproteobacteria bacterium]